MLSCWNFTQFKNITHKLKNSALQRHEILLFRKTFYSCVTSVPDFWSMVWEYQNFQVQDRTRRQFLGTQRLAPLTASGGECSLTIHSIVRQQLSSNLNLLVKSEIKSIMSSLHLNSQHFYQYEDTWSFMNKLISFNLIQ